ncbi:DUF6612 family protein [Anaerostipes sp.]|uniref:DUF6612 family protein n=1 Tax=Anaerostipes sp. TaxID=1872530 RepID=UPI0025BCAF03|nr:DUF6612 family protein [Anaerostipes sp.]MBS7007186.1 hypothetical protein [Anaerostipes sp.]
MKKFKKVLALTLAAAMLFTLGGCKKKSPEEVLKAANEKLNKMDSADMDGTIKMKMSSTSSNSSSFELKMGMKMKATGMTSKDMKMDMDITTAIAGQDLSVKAYYKDGYYYMNYSGQKVKQKMDVEAMQKQLENSTGQFNTSADNYKDLKMSKKDGNYVISFKFKEKAINDYVNKMMGQLNSTGSAGSSANYADQVKFDSMSGTMTVNKDSEIIAQKINMTVSSKQEPKMSIKMSADFKYNNIGKDVKVTLPSDLDTYKEAPAASAATTAASK